MTTQNTTPQAQSGRRSQHDMPLLGRSAAVGTVNVEARSVDLVWTTGAPVKRYDWWRERWYLEELSLDPAHVRMGRLQSGAANLLNTHSSWDLSSVLGVITSADIDGGEGAATVRFSRRPDVEPYFQDVVDGIVRSVSVGYATYAIEMIAPETEGGLWTYRAVDWEPYELSMVPIPADAGAMTRSADGRAGPENSQRTFVCAFTEVVQPPAAAGTQSRKGTHMNGEDTTNSAAQPQAVSTPAAPAVNQRALDEARQAGATAEAQRQQEIRDAVRLGGLDAAFADGLIAQRDMTGTSAGLAVLREMHARSAANPTRTAAQIETLRDETEQRRGAMADAITLRSDPRAQLGAERIEAARQYRGLRLMDMARDCIEAAGGSTRGMSQREVARMALNLERGMSGTSDFPEILGNTVNRSLRQAYDLQPRTFTGWCRQSTAPDFKQIARTQLSESSTLKQVKEGGEYKAVTFGESAEKYSLGKYGGIVALTWETLINDDLDAFSRIPLALAAEAGALESDIVYGILLGASKMADGKSLFDAAHGNLAAAGADIDEVSLSAARAAMRKQKGMKGRQLNLSPSFLIVGPDNELAANKYTSTNFVAASAGAINPAYNTSLEVVTEGRVEGLDWFMTAAPGLVDTIEYAYLEGEEGIFTEQRNGFEVDGVQIKVRHVFAAKAIDWRGLYKTPAKP